MLIFLPLRTQKVSYWQGCDCQRATQWTCIITPGHMSQGYFSIARGRPRWQAFVQLTRVQNRHQSRLKVRYSNSQSALRWVIIGL